MKIEDVPVSGKGFAAIRYYSQMNPDLDMVVLVQEAMFDNAQKIILKAIDAFENGEYRVYGDAVEHFLNENQIPFFVFYHPLTKPNKPFNWDEDEEWEEFVEHVNDSAASAISLTKLK